MRLGDLDALKEGLNYHFYPTDQEYETDRQWAVGYNAGLNRALHSIAYAKAIDAVPVCRCKDCEFSHMDGWFCGGAGCGFYHCPYSKKTKEEPKEEKAQSQLTKEEAIERIQIHLAYMGQYEAPKTKEALDMAIAALREQEERSINKPLTPDELREMGGKPYFHVSLQNGQKWWAILDPYYARRVEDYHYGEYWLAYRYELPEPPKEEV